MQNHVVYIMWVSTLISLCLDRIALSSLSWNLDDIPYDLHDDLRQRLDLYAHIHHFNGEYREWHANGKLRIHCHFKYDAGNETLQTLAAIKIASCDFSRFILVKRLSRPMQLLVRQYQPGKDQFNTWWEGYTKMLAPYPNWYNPLRFFVKYMDTTGLSGTYNHYHVNGQLALRCNILNGKLRGYLCMYTPHGHKHLEMTCTS